MYKNYLKIAWRNIWKNKVFSFINIFGLAIGFTCCILITLYIYHETNYDKHLPNRDRIFQIGTTFIDQGVERQGATSAGPLGKLLQQEYPEVVASSRLLSLFLDDKTLLQVKEGNHEIKSFYEQKGFLADPDFFNVIPYQFKEGDSKTALQQPNTVVVSESIANKLFGDQPALNKVIRISSSTNGDTSFRITGVFAAPSGPSQLDANFFISFKGGNIDGMANDNPSLANNNMFYTYLLLKDKTDAAKLQQKFPEFIHRHLGDELKQTGKERKYFLTAIGDIYLTDMENKITSGGSKTTLFILGSIAILTLLIACVNFMNLSTASSSKRAAEVGVRKVLGAQQQSLLRQFLGESVVMAALALFFALLFTFLLLPVFEQVAGKGLFISYDQKILLGGLFIVLALITGLLAGIYPAFYLSSFKPIKVLKGKLTNSLAAISLRKGLVIFQFIISIVLIVSSIIIARQMSFMRLKDLGFVKDQQIIIPLRTATAKNNIQAFKNEATNLTGIKSIGACMSYPGIFQPNDWLMYKQGQTMNNSKQVYTNLVDDDFLKTLGVRLIAGRLFSKEFPADTVNTFVINEETVKQFGFASPQDAIGKWLGFDIENVQRRFTIVGVVKNFHFKDLHENIEPFAFRLRKQAGFNYMIAHSQGENIKEAVSSVETIWKKLNPDEPFEYSFLDLDFQKNYEADERRASLINYFTIIAIIISCLGLFGLATFTAEQRRKEIGIRKVLGASIQGVVGLLSKDFLKLVAIAFIIASPIAWYVMNKWLQNFAYPVSITWQIFAFAAVISIAIAFFTISFQAVKTALMNPVKSLRTE